MLRLYAKIQVVDLARVEIVRRLIAIIVLPGVFLALLVLSSFVLEQPMAVEPVVSEGDKPVHIRIRRFSEVALAGRSSFGNMCAECHGSDAQGTETAPPLTNQAYATDFRDSRMFHNRATRPIPAHEEVLAAVSGTGELDFNTLERMAKFLREARRVASRE